MEGSVLQMIALICIFFRFGEGYVLLAPFHADHPGKCSLEKRDLNPPLPNLSLTSMEPGQVIGTEYNEEKNYCNMLKCSLWKNHKGEGYRLENNGCAQIVKRPDDCSLYTKENNTLPWPECCYFRNCPIKRD